MEVALPDDPERLTKDMSAAFYRLAVDDGFATLEDLDSVLPDLDRFYPPTLPEHRYEKPQANGPPKAREGRARDSVPYCFLEGCIFFEYK